MAKPISQERMDWIHERMKVIEPSISIAQSTMYAVRSGGVGGDVLQQVLRSLHAERTQLSIELQVLKKLVVGE